MNYINDSMRGLSVLVNLNMDRLLFVAALVAALCAGAYISHP